MSIVTQFFIDLVSAITVKKFLLSTAKTLNIFYRNETSFLVGISKTKKSISLKMLAFANRIELVYSTFCYLFFLHHHHDIQPNPLKNVCLVYTFFIYYIFNPWHDTSKKKRFFFVNINRVYSNYNLLTGQWNLEVFNRFFASTTLNVSKIFEFVHFVSDSELYKNPTKTHTQNTEHTELRPLMMMALDSMCVLFIR